MSGGDEMTPASSATKLTYDDFLLFPDDGQRHELIDGEHYVTPTPYIPHQRIVGNLFFLIRSYIETNPIGKVFGAPLDVIFRSSMWLRPISSTSRTIEFRNF